MKTNDNKKLALIIPEIHANERFDQVLAKLLPDYSRTQIQEWIATGAILIDGHIVKGKTKAKGSEHVTVDVILKVQPAWEPQNIELNVVYEDDALIVINKPVGLVVHPGAGNADRTLLNALLHHSPQLKDLPRAGIIHRLDKDTSGLLVIAKTHSSLRNLTLQLKKRTILREYQAIVHGCFISGGMVNAPIDRHPMNRKRMAVVDTGKEAITHYRIAEKYRAHTRLTVRLETGRTHQIRVHMAHIQHPIVGDCTYGTRVQLAKGLTPPLIQHLRQFRHQALHAFALGLDHPVTNEPIRWEAPLPEDIQQLIETLRQDMVEIKD